MNAGRAAERNSAVLDASVGGEGADPAFALTLFLIEPFLSFT